jgi:glycosyltransferase involved in cell wall biosynthesis
MSAQRAIALLGRRDAPTDALEEYCSYLAAALSAHGVALQSERLPWHEEGWHKALRDLRRRATDWNGVWVFVQYTALSWSERGFPLRFPAVLQTLRAAGARIAVVFHDTAPYSGNRAIDRLRRRAQLRSMRRAAASASLCVFTVPLAKVTWRPPLDRSVFIPVGANLIPSGEPQRRADDIPTVAIYGITGGSAGHRERDLIVRAMRAAAERAGRVRLVAFGRNADAQAAALRSELAGIGVDVVVHGVIPADEVRRQLAASDVLLFVRGQISSRRGSAIAAIACGLPVIAFAGSETAPPITDAGVLLVDEKRNGALEDAVLRVLTDAALRQSLAERSRRAQRDHFSWQAIAARYAEEMRRCS